MSPSRTGPLTLRMMERLVSSMNSTRTYKHSNTAAASSAAQQRNIRQRRDRMRAASKQRGEEEQRRSVCGRRLRRACLHPSIVAAAVVDRRRLLSASCSHLRDSTARSSASQQLHNARHANGVLRRLDLSRGGGISSGSGVLLSLHNTSTHEQRGEQSQRRAIRAAGGGGRAAVRSALSSSHPPLTDHVCDVCRFEQRAESNTAPEKA